MALGQNSSAITEFMSEAGCFKLSDASGCYTGATIDMPLIEDFNFEDTTDQTSRTDAGGNTYTTDGARTRTFTGNFMQTDVDTLNAFSSTYRGERLFFVKELSKTDGVFFVAPKAKVTPNTSFSAPGGQVPFELSIEALSGSLDVAAADFDNAIFSTSLSGTITIPPAGYLIFQQS